VIGLAGAVGSFQVSPLLEEIPQNHGPAKCCRSRSSGMNVDSSASRRIGIAGTEVAVGGGWVGTEVGCGRVGLLGGMAVGLGVVG
jgi:hypothetical protein